MDQILSQLRTTAGLDHPEWRDFLKRWLFISLLLHVLAAWFSIGIYDLDEHFQTLEFVAQHLGRAEIAKMPWEFGQQQRAWIQPLIYAAMTRGWEFLGIDEPLFWVASYRGLSALLGWFATGGLALCCFEWFKGLRDEKKWRNLAVRGLVLLWCLPYFHARTSSESFSGSLFFIGVSLLCLSLNSSAGGLNGVTKPQPSEKIALISGFLWAFAGYTRYQIGPMLMGVTAWCLIIARLQARKLLWIVAGALGAVAFGLVLDRMGYGFWTASPWNHLVRNVLSGKAAQEFGAQPWWFYIWFIVEYLPLLSAPLGAAVALGWLAAPLNVLTWITLPMFFMLSFAVQHKELRFIFPALSAAPILATFAVAMFFNRVSLGFLRKPLWILFVIANAIVLAVSTLKPSSSHPLLYDHIYAAWPRIQELRFIGPDPYTLGGAHIQFYKHPGFRSIQEPNWDAVTREIKSTPKEIYLFHDHFELPPEAAELKGSCQLEYTVFPDWLRHFMFFPGIRNSACKWSVYRCALIE